MCGIFGYLNRQGKTLAPESVRAMGDVMAYRGPDGQGIHHGEGFALGNQRLSIIDIAGGNQPFYSDDGQIIVVQNGEIFNHIELAEEAATRGNSCRTHSDTETILRLYELDGIDAIRKFNGMFAIAIYDGRKGELYIIRDRIGIKPLYLYDNGIQAVFGSEIKSILKAGILKPEVNAEAIHHFLAFNYVPTPHTMYQGIHHVMPGHYVRLTQKSATTHKWWDLATIEPIHNRTETDWIEGFNTLLDDAVRLRLRSDVPFGAFLSGGVDSSTIVGLMANHVNDPIQTFCIGFDDPRFDESPFAAQAAARFGTKHTLEKVKPDMLGLWPMATWHCDQPHGDVSFLPTYRVSALAAKHVKVVLTGDGGDELFAGYDKYKAFFKDHDTTSDNTTFRQQYFDSISLFTPESRDALYTPQHGKSLHNVSSLALANPYFEAITHQDRINQCLFMDMQLLLSGNNLVKPDRMGMAVSIEARAPFLDYRMMEYAFTMPGHLKLKDGETKYLYKKAVTSLIGRDLAYRRKQMFTVPVGEWFKTIKVPACQQAIDHLASRTDMFSRPAMQNLLDSHIAGTRNNTRELRALMALSHWYTYVYDEMPLPIGAVA